jgi:hypothetical protein
MPTLLSRLLLVAMDVFGASDGMPPPPPPTSSLALSDSHPHAGTEFRPPAPPPLGDPSPPAPGAAPGLPEGLAQVADFSQLPQGLLFAAEQYLLASDQRGAQAPGVSPPEVTGQEGAERSAQGPQSSRPFVTSGASSYPYAAPGSHDASGMLTGRKVFLQI